MLNEGVTHIGGGAFSFCLSLKSISLPKSLQEIGIYAFDMCNISRIIIPYGTKDIFIQLFYNDSTICKKLVEDAEPPF